MRLECAAFLRCASAFGDFGAYKGTTVSVFDGPVLSSNKAETIHS
jgi:hypothetical protein